METPTEAKRAALRPPLSPASRSRGAILGLCIGDALAMPVHWYYNRAALFRDYGKVTRYLAPRNPHPDSILWRSAYRAPGPKGEILHDQAPYWGKPGIHYHQFLRAGENTLNVKLCRLLIDSLNARGGYDPGDYLERYIAFMTTPGSHRDTYIEEAHRHFFTHYAEGKDPFRCAATEKHIGGLVGMFPILAFYAGRPEKALEAALAHLALTHAGPRMAAAGESVARLFLETVAGRGLKEAISERIDARASPFFQHPYRRFLSEADERVVGVHLSPACYVEDAVPAVFYLALKYHGDPESGLIANTGLGGDNASRGAVLGALLGAENGAESFPGHWVEGLRGPPPELEAPLEGR